MNMREIQNREAGFALVMTILVVVIVGSLVTGAAVIGANHMLVNRYYERQSELEIVAEAGVEVARSRLNADPRLYPDEGYVALQTDAPVMGPDGEALPGVTRSLYAGPTGVTSGQYGVFGTILAVVQDEGGGQVIRRSQVYQESFSKYAYFTDVEPSNISFGGGDQIFGPVHSNSPIKIYDSGATFFGKVTTAENVPDPDHGDFRQGFEENVPVIDMPQTADLTKLRDQGAEGNTSFTGNRAGAYGEATTRIEFIALDLNDDGDRTDENEGFIRIYQSDDAEWVTAGVSGGGCGWVYRGRWRWECADSDMPTSVNCGAWYGDTWVAAADHPYEGNTATDALTSPNRRCYLGGADEINGRFESNDGRGEWLRWPDDPSPLLSTRDDAEYLFPISRSLNPNFKGVIYVNGNVVISGQLRGRVTVAATGDIILGDDLTYVTDPGAGTCVDILGMFSGGDVIVADNAINAPQIPANGLNHRTYDDTSDEFFHGTVLALGVFTANNHASGSQDDEWCQGSSAGRGCLFLTGGIIQSTRGPVGTTSGTGYVKRYSYDQCGATNPPPYFPTTGYFAQGQRYRVDPSNFEVADFFDFLTPGNSSQGQEQAKP